MKKSKIIPFFESPIGILPIIYLSELSKGLYFLNIQNNVNRQSGEVLNPGMILM